VKDENARLLYSREPGNALPIEIVDQAPMIGIPPLEKGPFSAFFPTNHPRLQPLSAPKPKTDKNNAQSDPYGA
jgi:hypothetical protein